MLYQQHGQFGLGVNFAQPFDDLVNNHRGQPQGQLIDQQQLRPADQGAADGQHLAFAPGQQACGLVPELGQPGKIDEDFLFDLLPFGAFFATGRDDFEVFSDGQVRENLVTLRHQDDAFVDRSGQLQPGDVFAKKADPAGIHPSVVETDKARNRPESGGFSGPVGPEKRCDLPLRDPQVDSVQRED